MEHSTDVDQPDFGFSLMFFLQRYDAKVISLQEAKGQGTVLEQKFKAEELKRKEIQDTWKSKYDTLEEELKVS